MSPATRPGPRQRIRAAALKLLERRACGRRDLLDRLARRGFDAQLCADVVRGLEAAGLVDDEAFARDAAAAMARRGPVAREMIASRLRARGLEREVAEQVAADAAEDPLQAAGRYAVEQRRRLRRLAPAVARRRIAAALARRGFDVETVTGALRSAGLGLEGIGEAGGPEEDLDA